MTKKIILGSLATVAVIATPIATVISCGKQEKWADRNNTFENIKWKKSASESGDLIYSDATILSWHDGDTPKVKFKDSKLFGKINISSTGVASIRIAAIDTPEIASGGIGTAQPTTGKEHEYAVKGKELGLKEMPVGTTVRIVQNGTSYNRVVGNIFYDKDKNGTFESSWSVTIMNAGLAMPFISDAALILDKSNPIHYIGKPFADAYNYVVENKIGMFGHDLDDMLKIHGKTDVSTVAYRKGELPIGQNPNIYDYYKQIHG